MCQIIEALTSLPSGVVPAGETAFPTVVGARLGGKYFGTAPGNAEVWATLRSETDETMKKLVECIETTASEIAMAAGLKATFEFEDIFFATVNAERIVDMVRKAAVDCPIVEPEKPFRWSEDFGRFTAISDGALIGIGAGEKTPPLHDPYYNFPEELIPIGAGFIMRIIRTCLE